MYDVRNRQDPKDPFSILPKNICFLILGFAFDLNLSPNNQRGSTLIVDDAPQNRLESDQNKKKSLNQKQIETLKTTEQNFALKIRDLNKLGLINKRWKDLVASESLWEMIFSNFKDDDQFSFEKAPTSFSFKQFNNYCNKRMKQLNSQMSLIEALRYIERSCYICPLPRNEPQESKGCDIF